MKSKKTGSTGRYGSKYGLGVRRRVFEIERKQKSKHQCPECGKYTVKRVSAGIFLCKNCGMKIAGKAYTPE